MPGGARPRAQQRAPSQPRNIFQPRGPVELKTLHTYLVRQVLASLFLTVAVFTFVLLLGNVLREILTLLVSGHASLGTVAQAVGLLIPFVWVFALPMGLLTAMLLVFGRFSADHELTAARASGLSLLSLITPVLLLSLLCCALSALINMELGPRCRVAYVNLLFKVRGELLNAQLPEGRYIRDFPGYIFYTEKNRGGQLENVTIVTLAQAATNNTTTVMAPRGRLEVDAANKQYILHLTEARSVTTGARVAISSSPELTLNFDMNSAANKTYQPRISDLTFWQLRAELADLEGKIGLPPAIAATNSAALKAQLVAARNQVKDLTEPIRVEMNRQVAFSFACFGFTLVGIPLGIRVHRRETNIGVAIALGLVLIYYCFILTGQALAARPEFAPHLIVWLPNFLFQAVGVVLLWRANRGI